MTDGTPLSGVLTFLRQQGGVAFCFDCLANAVGIAAREIGEHLRRVSLRDRSPVELGRGRCSVCRSETEVARHKLH